MSKVIPKGVNSYRHACHMLMDEIWGQSKGGKAQAYKWLQGQCGKTIHFSQLSNERELKEIHEKLYVLSFQVVDN